MNNSIYPLQKLTLKEKLEVKEGEKVPKWVKANAEYFSGQAGYNFQHILEIQNLYKIADGFLDSEAYKYIENPFNTEDVRYQKYPARLRNYDIIRPIVDRLLGEREETPINQIVVGTNENSVNEIKEGIKDVVDSKIKEMFSARVSNAETNGEQFNIEEIETDVLLNYNQKKTKHARIILERIKRSQNLSDKLQKAFYDYLVCGRPVSYKCVNHDDVIYEILHPENVIGIGWDDSNPYLEDCTGAVCYRYWSPNTIIDRWREKLTNDQIDYLMSLGNTSIPLGGNHLGLSNGIDRTKGWNVSNNGIDYFIPYNGSVTVEHIVWKTLAKRGILHYNSDFGEEKMEVDEDYELEIEKGDIKIEWKWENEWWEVYRLVDNFERSNNDGTVNTEGRLEYLYWGAGEVQRNELNNTSVCKLPYNQVKRGYSYGDVVQSVVKDGIPYQILYNILHYRFELTLARNKDKIMLFPLGLIPNTKGWSVDKWMHQLHAFSIAFFNEQSERAQAAIQAIKEIDMSLGKYMADMWGLMASIKNEWWERIGFNRQRYGEQLASDGKATTQNAVYRSTVSTKNLAAQFERWLEKEFNGLVDYGKYAFAKGKQGLFVNSYGQIAMMDVDPIQFMDTEYNVFVVNSFEERENIELIKQIILQPLAQNGTDTKSLIDIAASKTTEEIKELAKKADSIQKKFELQKQQQVSDIQKYVADKGMEQEQLKSDTNIEVAKIRAEAQIEAALITSDSFNAQLGDTDGDNIDESDEIVNRHFDRVMKINKGQMDMEKFKNNQRSNDAKLEMDKRKMESQERIAIINKNKYDS